MDLSRITQIGIPIFRHVISVELDQVELTRVCCYTMTRVEIEVRLLTRTALTDVSSYFFLEEKKTKQ